MKKPVMPQPTHEEIERMNSNIKELISLLKIIPANIKIDRYADRLQVVSG